MLSRRAFLASSFFTAVASSAHAQTFPGALIRIVVPAAPGGGTDILARAMSQQLQTMWGQTVIIENRAGAAGLIGTRAVIAAAGDGHTLLMGATSAIMSLAVNTPSPFEISRDLAPVTLVSAPPYILVAHPSVPAKNAAELIAYAKANPGKLNYGSSGAGAASHLSGALFAQMAGIDMLHVPYRGMGPAVPDLLGGRIQMIFAPAVTVTPHIAVRHAADDRDHRRRRAPRCSRTIRPSRSRACPNTTRSDGSACSRRRRRRRRWLRASARTCARCWSPTI